MNATQETTRTPAQNIEAAALALGITMEAKFVPWSQSRNKGEKHPSLNWLVTFKRSGREFLATDYSAGCGHCPSYNKKPPHNWDRSDRDWQPTVLRWECENGYAATFSGFIGFSRSNIPTKRAHIEPELAGVLASLVLDSSVIDAGGFDAWAREYGYATDSRKAEAIYNACLETALKMRAALGDKGMEMLRNACQDY